MIRIIDGKPVEVSDDDRITPEMKVIRSHMNQFLAWIGDRENPRIKEIERQYREGMIPSPKTFQWFMDMKNLEP